MNTMLSAVYDILANMSEEQYEAFVKTFPLDMQKAIADFMNKIEEYFDNPKRG